MELKKNLSQLKCELGKLPDKLSDNSEFVKKLSTYLVKYFGAMNESCKMLVIEAGKSLVRFMVKFSAFDLFEAKIMKVQFLSTYSLPSGLTYTVNVDFEKVKSNGKSSKTDRIISRPFLHPSVQCSLQKNRQ